MVATTHAEKMKKDSKYHQFIEDYADETKACIERARHWTESFKKTMGEPRPIRVAKALANHLEKMTIYIMPHEIIVGASGKDPSHLPFYVELQPLATLKESTVSESMLTPEEWKELEEIYKFWDGQTLRDMMFPLFPDEVKKQISPLDRLKLLEMPGYQLPINSPAPDLKMILSIGLEGAIKMVEARLAELDLGKLPPDKLEDALRQRDMLNAMIISGKGAMTWAQRYSKLARETAEKTTDPVRKQELLQIAENCAQVPAKPARTFWQAIQSIWFIHMLTHVYESISVGYGQRLDQDLYPYYKQDIEAGRLTRDQAMGLLEALWVKFERDRANLRAMSSMAGRGGQMGGTLLQNISLAGTDEQGRDATNDLTHLMLESIREVRTVQPALSIKYHPKISDDLLINAYETVKAGTGMPAFHNDKPIIAHLMAAGMPLSIARVSATPCCSACCIPGTAHLSAGMSCAMGALHLAKVIELAMNDGVDMLDGEQLGPRTGDPRNFKTFDDLLQAFRTQLDYACKIISIGQAIYQSTIGTFVYRPITSLMCPSSIKRGQNIASYNDWANPLINTDGLVDVADSLTAVKKLIYDDKKITWDEMLKALKANFEGYENYWQLCHDAPKFGDDDDYADDIMITTMNITHESMAKNVDKNGAKFRPIYHSVSSYITNGRLVAALPYSRKARQPLADGGVSPSTGFGRSPLKVLKSLAKLDHDYISRGLLNQKLSPSTTPRQFIHYIRTWGELGISHVQFNMVDANVLRDAQAHPEKYPDLIVRVAGYSAHFVYLAKDAQDSIINRSELTL